MAKLKWTKKHKEIAALVAQGQRYSEIVKAGYSGNMTARVQRALKEGDEPPAAKTAANNPTLYRQPKTMVRDRVVDAVELGALLAIPEDWRLNQHDVYLLLDTYYLTKQEISYEGTIGEFMGLLCRVYRHAMQYTEMPEVGPVLLLETSEEGDNGREEDGEGRGSGEEGVSDDSTESWTDKLLV